MFGEILPKRTFLETRLILDADAALRTAAFERSESYDIYDYCRRPLVIYDTDPVMGTQLGL